MAERKGVPCSWDSVNVNSTVVKSANLVTFFLRSDKRNVIPVVILYQKDRTTRRPHKRRFEEADG